MDLTSNHPYWPLNSGLIRSYPSLKTDLDSEVLVLGAGITEALCAYHLIKTGMDVPRLQAEYAARRAAGIELDFLSQADVEARFSFSQPAALLSMVAAEVDVYRLTHRLLQRSQEVGARIFDRTEMASYNVGTDGVTVKTESGATVHAKWIVFATVTKSSKFSAATSSS